jgi:hypothetical protein
MSDPTAEPRVVIPLPPPTIFEVFRVRFIGQFENAMTVNVMYYESDHPTGSATEAEQIEILQLMAAPNSLLSAYVSCCTTDWAFVQATVDTPTTPQNATFVYQPAGLFGINALPRCPCQMGVTIRKVTQYRGRKGRGRITVPAVPMTWVSGTALIEQSNYTTLCERLTRTLNGTVWNYRPCLWSHDKAAPFTQRTIAITAHKTNIILGTARRRKPGVGK